MSRYAPIPSTLMPGTMYQHVPNSVAVNLNRPSGQFKSKDSFAERLEFYLQHGTDKVYDPVGEKAPDNKVERKFLKKKKNVPEEKHEQLKKILEFEDALDARISATQKDTDEV